jgi:hypothetical protein
MTRERGFPQLDCWEHYFGGGVLAAAGAEDAGLVPTASGKSLEKVEFEPYKKYKAYKLNGEKTSFARLSRTPSPSPLLSSKG